MDGAEALLRALVDCGVEVCFTNPGTTEMHVLAALDRVPTMRPILCAFEGVATGAADGYARMAGRPACTLLHLGPGFANGIANLHNARRAHSPIVNIVGDHATYHHRFDAPLESDIESLARPVSAWFRSSASTHDLPGDVVAAIEAATASPGGVATLVVPSDVAWSPFDDADTPSLRPTRAATIDDAQLRRAVLALRSGEPTALLLGGPALREGPLRQAASVAAATGARLLAENFPARMQRGAGRPAAERIAYLPEAAMSQLRGLRHLILVGARSPVSFFAYQTSPSDLVPEDCQVLLLAAGDEDILGALGSLEAELGGGVAPALADPARPEPPRGALTPATLAAAVGSLLPDHAVVVDEANTSGTFLGAATAGCPPHDWLCLTGGAIGQGMPVATGAAVAAPGRPVLNLQADGSALYTLQSLWTQAREGLDVTTVLLANRSYAILNFEFSRLGVDGPTPRAQRLLELDNPAPDWVQLAGGLGVDAARAESAEELVDELGHALATPGPSVIEAVLTRG
jgi:acetolactate synthase I/II/III large subunit